MLWFELVSVVRDIERSMTKMRLFDSENYLDHNDIYMYMRKYSDPIILKSEEHDE